MDKNCEYKEHECYDCKEVKECKPIDNETAYHYFFSAIETGEQIDVNTKEGHAIYLKAEQALEKIAYGNLKEVVFCKDCTYGNHCDIEDILCMYDEPETLYCSQGKVRER